MNACKALVLLSLVVPIEVGYIEDPRNEGTETRYLHRTVFAISPRYIEDPRNEGTETPIAYRSDSRAWGVTLRTRGTRGLKLCIWCSCKDECRSYIEDPRNEGTETAEQRKPILGQNRVTLRTRGTRGLKHTYTETATETGRVTLRTRGTRGLKLLEKRKSLTAQATLH